MKIPSLSGLAAAGLYSLLTTLPTVHALSFDAVSIPEFDLSSLGRVTIAGDFDGVSLYEYKDQAQVTRRNGASLLTPLPNGILTNLSSADAQIKSMCSFTQKDGTFAGIFVGGDFKTLGGVDSPGAALFNPNSSKVTALKGLDGSVSTVLCDKDSNRVYVGGDFSYKDSTNAVAWSPDDGWTDLPFDGINGPVHSILKTSNGHIMFGGAFDGVGNTTSNSSKNKHQTLNLQNATITSNSDSSLSGFEDPRNIVCSTSGESGADKTYLLYDAAPGFWQADLGFDVHPTKIRLYNTHYQGRGTKSFLFQALPDNGIMNMSYTDDSGKKAYCDQSCPLPSTDKDKYREFTLVNPVGMQGFKLQIQDWYGQGAGLNGIEVFQDQIVTYAVDQYNEPSCAGIETPSKSTRKGSWTTKNGYLSTQVTGAGSDASIVFEPDLKEAGNYSVLVWTPGCSQDGTCATRKQVDVSATFSTNSDSKPVSKTISQTNADDKYDPLFDGFIDASSGSFRPSVTLRPVSGQGDATVVASRVEFKLISAKKTGGLNGLYDFDPSSKSISSDLDKSEINKATEKLDHDSSITSLAEHKDIIYVAGNFSSSKFHHIMSIADGNATALPGGGLNKGIADIAILDDVLYVGGNFTDTNDGGEKGLSYVASYSPSSDKWSALGAGLNGRVETIYPIQLNVSSAVNETTIAVSGDFDQIEGVDGKPAVYVPGFAIWLPSNKTWLQSLNDTQMQFAGQLSAVASVNETSILAGSLATSGYTASGAVWLHESHHDLDLIPLSMKLNHTKSSAGVITGVYDTDSDRNLTIVGGQFSARSSKGSTIENVAILDGSNNTIYGLPSGLSDNSTFLSMLVHNNTLYAGGNVTGTIADSKVGGLIAYDLSKGAYSETQPWALNGNNVSVNSIALRPGTSEIYVGGNFDKAGSLPCTSVCALDKKGEWNWPGTSISGNVMALEFASASTLYAVGNMEVGGNKTVVASLSVKSGTWSALSGASESDVPGNVTAFTPASKDLSSFWIAGTARNGSAYLLDYDGSKFQSPGDLFSKGTVIRGMEMLPLQKDSSASKLKGNQLLLIMGELIIPDFGHASAALYNGTGVTPFILSSKSDGKPGSMSQLFSQHTNPFSSKSSHHSNGIVVLVAFCCALGCVFLIVAAGVIMNKIQRRRQGYTAAPQTFGTDRPTDMQRVPPEYLFNSLGSPNPGAPAI
ncbi:hypothetical protein N7492_000764 [Penicillium capsulatum]|uniref:Cellular morphogenesis protein n=1 Tax=Penicillium capsulatum TaxID=69766 RepID=A0A9W9IQ62_9EURO|nr:hypothetical protein N7492_000764 [Penicillium capsulatum]KAJ6130176.1 hypothetical protein N7512_002956 [Penicillium capsulatum]